MKPTIGRIVTVRTSEPYNGSSEHPAIVTRVWSSNDPAEARGAHACINVTVLPDCGEPFWMSSIGLFETKGEAEAASSVPVPVAWWPERVGGDQAADLVQRARASANLSQEKAVALAVAETSAGRSPRVTPADLEAEIVSEWYINGATGVVPDDFQPPVPADHPLGLLTICVLVLRNGFTVTGESACVSPENFNAEIGRKVARQHAVEKLWPLLGFRLRDQLLGKRD